MAHPPEQPARRRFLCLLGGAAAAAALQGCRARSMAFRQSGFDAMDQGGAPFAGLARSLHEEQDYLAEVEGRLPDALRGTLFRNGPGLFDRAGLRKRALLDGDGLVQAFRFHDGSARYGCRYVRTKKYTDEASAGSFIYPTISTQRPGGFRANLFRPDDAESQAGVTVVERNGRLFAFGEYKEPYELDPETLETVGPTSLGLDPGHAFYAAHWKIDGHNGHWLHFGTEYGPRPKLHLTSFDRQGRLLRHRVDPLPRFTYMHDYFVTERHILLHFQPLYIAFWGFLFGRRSMADSLRWRPEEGTLLLVYEREGVAEPLRLNADPCFMWHSINAYERGDELLADFIGYDAPDHLIGDDPVIKALMEGRPGRFQSPGELRRHVIDLRGKTVRTDRLDSGSYEWPFVNPHHRCHPYRFAYSAKTREGEFFWTKITRIDLESGKTATFDFGPGIFCSEPVFVPLPGYPYSPHTEDEPGWLLTEGYDSRTQKSFLAVLDAGRLEEGPLATVRLSHHVPFSFHGYWAAAAPRPLRTS